jgi:hypothetical protein
MDSDGWYLRAASSASDARVQVPFSLEFRRKKEKNIKRGFFVLRQSLREPEILNG